MVISHSFLLVYQAGYVLLLKLWIGHLYIEAYYIFVDHPNARFDEADEARRCSARGTLRPVKGRKMGRRGRGN